MDIRICEECKEEKEFYARGLCKQCYRKIRKSPEFVKIAETRPKSDYTFNVCGECFEKGIPLIKGKCRSCYGKEQEIVRRNDPVAYQRKLDNLRSWQAKNPEKVKQGKRASYQRNKDEIKEAVKKYRIENKDKIAAQVKARYEKDPEKYKFRRIKQVYGLEREDYEKLLSTQNNACAICKKAKVLVVDHDHTTGKVRQLLCGDCNTTLGFLERQGSEVFMNHLEYIKTHKEIKENDNATTNNL